MAQLTDEFHKAKTAALRADDQRISIAMEQTLMLVAMAHSLGVPDGDQTSPHYERFREAQLMAHYIAMEMLNRMLAKESCGTMTIKEALEKKKVLADLIKEDEDFFGI
jgi:hypothetical protein